MPLKGAALISVIHRYLERHPNSEITLLDVHNLMYLLDRALASLHLNIIFWEELHGPYSPQIRGILQPLMGYYLSGYVDGENLDVPVELIPGADEEARAKFQLASLRLDASWRLHRISELIDICETSLELELLAKICWVVSNNQFAGDDVIIQSVLTWHPNQQLFTPDQIRRALQTLREKNRL